MSVSARISVALVAQEQEAGPFPSLRTYPLSFERYLVPGEGPFQVRHVVGDAGPVGNGVTIDLPALGFTSVKCFALESLDPAGPGCPELTVTLTDAPVVGSIGSGQIIMATNDRTGWPAGVWKITGDAAANFRLIVVGC